MGIAAIVVFRQIDYARNVDLGFNRDDVVVLRDLSNLSPDVRDEPGAHRACGPGNRRRGAIGRCAPESVVNSFYVRLRSARVPEGTSVRFMRTGPTFASVYGIRLLAGRLPSESEEHETASATTVLDVLLSRTAARRLGYSPEQVVGQTLSTASLWGRMKVIGVLDDVAVGGVGGLPYPYVYLPESTQAGLSLGAGARRAAPSGAAVHRQGLALVRCPPSRWIAISSPTRSTTSSRRTSGRAAIFAVFVAVAVLIGCLGLFGLAVFTAERRTKEIGVRKVSGARTADIMKLMLWRISIPVLAANLVAWPVAYYYLRQWLEHYAYRISLNPTYFLGAGAVALLIAWATVYANTLRLARTNPVHSLRYE